MEPEHSPLEKERLLYRPRLPRVLAAGIRRLSATESALPAGVGDVEEIRARFPGIHGRQILELTPGTGPAVRPLKVGVVLSGGQAPGGHNVIAGLFDALTGLDPTSALYGFLGGPRGIFTERVDRLTGSQIDAYRNTGGFDLIGSGRDKIETDE
jgi:pyrophosphate--fructose-6-phosphate 1-phosphotransferase